MAGLYHGGRRYELRFAELADFAAVPVENRDAAVRAALERYVATLEALCRELPYNWFNFYDFWADADAERERAQRALIGAARPGPCCAVRAAARLLRPRRRRGRTRIRPGAACRPARTGQVGRSQLRREAAGRDARPHARVVGTAALPCPRQLQPRDPEAAPRNARGRRQPADDEQRRAQPDAPARQRARSGGRRRGGARHADRQPRGPRARSSRPPSRATPKAGPSTSFRAMRACAARSPRCACAAASRRCARCR